MALPMSVPSAQVQDIKDSCVGCAPDKNCVGIGDSEKQPLIAALHREIDNLTAERRQTVVRDYGSRYPLHGKGSRWTLEQKDRRILGQPSENCQPPTLPASREWGSSPQLRWSMYSVPQLNRPRL